MTCPRCKKREGIIWMSGQIWWCHPCVLDAAHKVFEAGAMR